jgi:tRNA U34 5-methylaminomethyl-2-thiouridine-forming methyltransferase MnmC
MESVDILLTEDGSHTLYSNKFHAAYHSHRGAVNESMIVFIQAGLEYFREKNPGKHIFLFEMGFGSGLNALLSCQFSHQNLVKVDYTGIEAFPVSKDIWQSLNYYDDDENKSLFYSLHSCPWDTREIISPFFSIEKKEGKLESFENTRLFDIIFYDAFAPGTQPELWEENIMQKMYNMLNEGGIMTTYCAKGDVKRALKKVGFVIESLPGPIGKREIIRALKPNLTH